MSKLDGVTAREIQMTVGEMKRVGQGVIDAMNAAQKNGHPIDQVLMATSYALGYALAQRGCFLVGDEPIKEALTPLYNGYQDARKKRMQS